MMTLFTEPAERANAMGVFGFVASGGGAIGVLLGGHGPARLRRRHRAQPGAARGDERRLPE